MTTETKKDVVRHLKGIIAALEKDEEGMLELSRIDKLGKDINGILDGKWNNGDEHRMTIRLPLGSRGVSAETDRLLTNIAIKRSIKVNIESDHARYCIVVFSKK